MLGNYEKRQHLIDLLSEYSEFISDEMCEDKDIRTVVSSLIYSKYIEGILDDMEECCPIEIEKDFKNLIETLEDGEFDLSEFEASIEELISAIERISFQNSNQYEDGISVSDMYDFTVAVSSSATPKFTFTPIVKKDNGENNTSNGEISEDITGVIPNVVMNSWIKHEHLISYLQFSAENKSIAWTSLDQTLGREFAIAISSSLTKDYFPKGTVFTEGFSYFSNFDVYGFKKYVKNVFNEEISEPEKDSDTQYVLVYVSLSDSKKSFNLLSCIANFTEQYASEPLDMRQAFADGDINHKMRLAIITNESFYSSVEDNDTDEEHIHLSYAKFKSYCSMLRFIIRLYGKSDNPEILSWCNSLRNTYQVVANRLSYYTLKRLELMSPQMADAIRQRTLHQTVDETHEETKIENKSIYDLSIREINLSQRAINCLGYGRILTVRDLTNLTPTDLSRLKHLGRSTYMEIVDKLKELGLSLKDYSLVNPSFRKILNSLCIVLNDTSSIAFLGAKMPSSIKANSALTFCYFDNTFGISFQVLGLTYYEEGDYTLVWTQDDTGLTVRGDTYENLQIVPIQNKALENRFSTSIKSRCSESFWSDDELGKTRRMESLDPFRHFSHPDDVLVHIINEEARKQEKIWAKIQTFVGVINGEEIFTAKLLNEPFDSCFGMHSGDNILIVRRKEGTSDYILVGIKKIISNQQAADYDVRANRRYPKLSEEDKQKYQSILTSLLSTLTPREADVIRMLLGLNGKEPMSPLEISKIYNVCVNRIYQIEAKVLRKLRHINSRYGDI